MMTGQRDTVYDRFKKSGRVMGPGHSMGPAFENEPRTAVGGDTSAQAPPGLRDSAETPLSCQDCKQFDGEGRCQKFSAGTSANMVCDGFEGDQEEPEAAPEGEPELAA